ncbi:RNA polymerase subunit sigma-70 [Flexivirga alba]|uniref:RNA polymerase subunit sigma-70 n=1 Tax=Flexivirga alba TaxID=702742 RepID=A0ABW2ACT0_9MICO
MTENTDQDVDFAALVERHRAELHAHCYRMLGSVYDADDAVQDTLIRAWRGAAGLRDGHAVRSWLYTIATNVCLTELRRRSRRGLPHDFSPAAEPHTPPGIPMAESVWIEPYPDSSLPPGKASPEAAYDQREAVELAFIAALQHLNARQRAVLILRDVLGFSAAEAATCLSTTVASVNSGLQRARAAVGERVPQRTQQATVRALGDDALRGLVERYVAAWETCDVAAFTAILTEDVTFAMPPLATWYTPRTSVETWARESPLNGEWRWKVTLSSANAQPALAFYAWDEAARTHLPFALNVLTLRGDRVCDVTAFIVRSTDAPDDGSYQRFPEQPMDQRSLSATYERFGLPARLD